MVDFLLDYEVFSKFDFSVLGKNRLFVSEKQFKYFQKTPKNVFKLKEKQVIKKKVTKEPFEVNPNYEIEQLDKIKKNKDEIESFELAKESLKRGLIFVTNNEKILKFLGFSDPDNAIPFEEFKLKYLDTIQVKKKINDFVEYNTNTLTQGEGYYYPRPIKAPEIVYIPEFEPHVIITDWFDDPKDWYYIKYNIEETLEQAYIAYNQGLYLSSFFDSVIGIELTLKYEYARINKNNQKLITKMLGGNGNLGHFLKNNCLKELDLENYKEQLENINNARSGTFHFNFNLLKKATLNIKPYEGNASIHINKKGEIIEEHKNLDGTEDKPLENYSIPTDNLNDWSHFAYYTYNTYHQITKKLYGKQNHAKFIKEGLEDYNKNKDTIYKNMKENY